MSSMTSSFFGHDVHVILTSYTPAVEARTNCEPDYGWAHEPAEIEWEIDFDKHTELEVMLMENCSNFYEEVEEGLLKQLGE